MPSNLDRLLHLVGVLGADAAWLLRGHEHVVLHSIDVDDKHARLEIHQEFGPAVLIARFPDDGSEEYGLQEMRLPAGASDREVQAAALLSMAFDNLTRIGPQSTRRVLKWAFDRYGITPAAYDSLWKIRDRRPKEPQPESAPADPPATVETTRLEAAPPDDPQITRGQQLRKHRQALGLSQEELASRVGLELVSRAQISQLERGVLEVDDAVWSQIQIALVDIQKEQKSEP